MPNEIPSRFQWHKLNIQVGETKTNYKEPKAKLAKSLN